MRRRPTRRLSNVRARDHRWAYVFANICWTLKIAGVVQRGMGAIADMAYEVIDDQEPAYPRAGEAWRAYPRRQHPRDERVARADRSQADVDHRDRGPCFATRRRCFCYLTTVPRLSNFRASVTPRSSLGCSMTVLRLFDHSAFVVRRPCVDQWTAALRRFGFRYSAVRPPVVACLSTRAR